MNRYLYLTFRRPVFIPQLYVGASVRVKLEFIEINHLEDLDNLIGKIEMMSDYGECDVKFAGITPQRLKQEWLELI